MLPFHRPANDAVPTDSKDSATNYQPFSQWESLRFMKGVMDECTHMANFPRKYFSTQTGGC